MTGYRPGSAGCSVAYFGAMRAIRLSEFNPQDGRRLAAKREYVIPNGIDDPCPELSISPLNSAATGDDRLRMLFVGILSEGKGVMVLIEACANLAARGVPFELEMMGQWESDEFAARAQRRIEELNLDKHIRFLGASGATTRLTRFAEQMCFASPRTTAARRCRSCCWKPRPAVCRSWRRGGAAFRRSSTTARPAFLSSHTIPHALADRLRSLAHETWPA